MSFVFHSDALLIHREAAERSSEGSHEEVWEGHAKREYSIRSSMRKLSRPVFLYNKLSIQIMGNLISAHKCQVSSMQSSCGRERRAPEGKPKPLDGQQGATQRIYEDNPEDT